MERIGGRRSAARLGLLAALTAAIFLLGGTIWSVLTKVALGALMAWALYPLCRWLEQRMGRTAAAAVSAAVFALALFSFAALLLPPLVQQFAAFSKGLPQALEEGYAYLQARFSGLRIDAAALKESVNGLLVSLGTGVFPFLMRSAGSVASFLAALFFSLVLCIYFLRDREKFLLYASMLVPLRFRRKWLYACAQVRRELTGYVRGQLIICAGVAALTAAGLFALRVPYALVLGLLMGLLDVIPYFGPVIGAVPILVFAAQSGMGGVLWALAVVALVQQLEANWLSPRVMGNATGLHPVTVMLGVFAFGTLAGVAGMLAAVPCMLCARAVFRVMRTEP